MRTLLFWFGLTQAPETRASFDAAMRMSGRLLLFQIKASDVVSKSGARRFIAQHHQLIALQRRLRAWHNANYPSMGYHLITTMDALLGHIIRNKQMQLPSAHIN